MVDAPEVARRAQGGTGMDFAEVVRGRRMVRHFTAEPVAVATLARTTGNGRLHPCNIGWHHRSLCGPCLIYRRRTG